MACSCPASMKRIYHADIQLFPELRDGLVSDGSPYLSTKVVTVCTQCGKAEFSIDESELLWFRKSAVLSRPVS
jgi:hypothetical protein